MKIKLLFLLIISCGLANAQESDSIKPYHKQHRFLREHFLFIGTNINYLYANNNNSSYSPSQYSQTQYYQSITNVNTWLPGFKIEYISYHKISPVVTFYNGEGLVYYHNKFTYAIDGNSFPPMVDTTVVNVNSNSLYINYTVGLRLALPNNFYFNVAATPHLLISSYHQTDYFSAYFLGLGQSSTLDTIGTLPFAISVFNVSATLGIGYRLFAQKQHPICIEFNFSPDIFDSNYLSDHDDFGEISFHRFSFEFNIGCKF